MGIILDLLTVGVIALFIGNSYRKGMVKCVLELVCIALSFIAALAYAPILADYVGGLHLGDLAVSGAQAITGSIDEYLPGLTEAGLTFAREFKEALLGPLDASIGGIVDTAAQIIRTRAISMLLFVLVFMLCFTILRILANAVSGLAKLPLISTLDKILGFILGAAEGITVCFLICAFISFLTVTLADYPPFITPVMNMIAQSVVFKSLYRFNPILFFF